MNHRIYLKDYAPTSTMMACFIFLIAVTLAVAIVDVFELDRELGFFVGLMFGHIASIIHVIMYR